MKKFRTATDENGRKHWYFWCYGCDCYHGFHDSWTFTNDHPEFPTVIPSMLTKWHDYLADKDYVCHLFIEDGKIRYLDDCSHEYKGKLVSLRDEE